MKIVEPKVEIITPINGDEILKYIEKVGRVCYKSEDSITDESAKDFVKNIIKRGHETVIEHFNITVKFVTDRGISHEIVRHRIASYAQESTRYCNYSKEKFDDEITVVMPINVSDCNDNDLLEAWEWGCRDAEDSYFLMIRNGATPQTARSVLPTCTKTEVMMTANLRGWRHFIKLRAAKAAHPDIRILAKDLLIQLSEQIPVIFDDLKEEFI